jgi:hypothetical protein
MQVNECILQSALHLPTNLFDPSDTASWNCCTKDILIRRESVWALFAGAQRGGLDDSEETVRTEQKGDISIKQVVSRESPSLHLQTFPNW